MDVDAYLHRIGYGGATQPDRQTLRTLHRRHLEAVPFENLDIHLGRPIVLDEAALFDKVVTRRRGGFCYELNGLFSALLRALGFRVTRFSAGVRGESGEFGPDFDHMTLRVDLDEPYLADVGFGDAFTHPLRLDDPAPQADGQRRFQIRHDGAIGTLLRVDDGTTASWSAVKGYQFRLQPRALIDYAAMCRFHQTSPDSGFTRRRMCTRTTPTGRITIADSRLIVTDGHRREERAITPAEWPALLEREFGFDRREAEAVAALGIRPPA